jgi:serine/threonine protein kinase
LLDHSADVDALDRWKNTPLADAEGAKKKEMIELLKTYGGHSFGQNGSHFEPKPVPPPLPNKCDWEIEPSELDFSTSSVIGKGSFGEILRAYWRGTPVAVKRILPSLSDDRLVTQDFRHEVNLLVKLRHPNIVQFLGAVTERKPLMLITEFLRGGDLHQYLKEKGALSPSVAVNFALDMARGMAYLHNEPNVVIHRDLKPRNVLLVNSNADHLKVGDFGLSKLITVNHANDIYKLTGETGSYRYMAPEVFKHRKYDKKVDVFSFAMILYEMIEGDPPLSNYEPYEAAKHVADGHRPSFRSKGLIPDLKDLIEQSWSADKNQRPSFLEILKRLERIKESLSSDNHWHHIFST